MNLLKARLWRKYCVMEHNRQNNLWKKNFYILWAGQAISVLTSSILQMALIWYLTAQTGSALVLSLASDRKSVV